MHRQRFISNTVFLVLTSLVAQLVNLFVLPLFIENLGEEMYGIFVLSGILLGYLGLLDFGFTQGMTRYIGRAYAEGDAERMNRFITAGFWFLFVVGMVASSLIYFGRFAIVDFFKITEGNRDIAANLLAVSALFSLIGWPARLPGTIMYATLHIKQISIWDAIQSVLTSVTMLILVYHAVDVVSIRVTTGIIGVCGLAPKLYLVHRYVPKAKCHPLKFHFSSLKEMSSFSLGFFYAQVLGMLALRIDHIIIGKMLSVSMIAPYVVATKLFSVMRRYTSQVFGAFLPTVYSLDGQESHEQLQTLLNYATRYRALLFTPMAYLGIVISPTFIRVWMGNEYAHYAIWSQLFLLVFLFNPLGISVNMAKGLGHLRACNSLASIGTVLNLTLSVALIPRFGIGGPMLGTVIPNLVFSGYITSPYFCKMCGLDWKKSYADVSKITAANLPIALVALWVQKELHIVTWAGLLILCAIIISCLSLNLLIFFVSQREKDDVYTALESVGLTRLPIMAPILQKILVTRSNTA